VTVSAATSQIRSGIPRWIEATMSFGGLVALSPLIGGAMLAVRLSSPGPVFFVQQRVGRNGRLFPLYKLRTMRANAGGPGVTGKGDPRITRVGAVLRKTKLDELPQLWNVVRGDMSLVGPRPEVPKYADAADPRWARVLAVRPGITDPLTVRLRDEESLMPAGEAERERFYVEVLQPMKLAGYAEYLERRSGWTDVGVIFATLGAILRPARPDRTAEAIKSGRL
jgi:lipopolysaccharide/colanic/teichoic acid biosynthesis glycosyltransferase